ncbi:MAG: DMT family transporter [Amylibacter sp.]|nr:DMT family transporter [Amylibacter sp.]
MDKNFAVNNRGAAICMIAAMFILGFTDNFIVFISEVISLWQFQMLRAAIALPLIALIAWVWSISLRPKRFWAVGLRSIFLSVSMVFYFWSLAFIPLAQALAGLFTSPIFILLISGLILRQKIGLFRIVAVSIGFIGIILVVDTKLIDLTFFSFLPVLGGLFYAMAAIATRQLCEGETTLSLLAMLMIVQSVVGAFALTLIALLDPEIPVGTSGFVLRGWVWPISSVLPWIIIQALGAILGIGLIFKAYQIGQASQVAVFEYSALIFGPFFAWLLIGQQVSIIQFLGIALIASAGTIIAIRSLKE